MRKVWIYRRKNRPGVYVCWYDDTGKQRSKRLPDERTAKLYRTRREHELNTDLYHDATMLPWDELRGLYEDEKRNVARLSENSLISIRGVLNLFERHCGTPYSTHFNQALVTEYVRARTAAGTSPATINKDLRTLQAFVAWAVESNYMGEPARQIKWHRLHQTEEARIVKAVSVQQFARVLATAERLYGRDWRIRLLLAIATGLRLRDVERIRIEEVDFDRCSMQTRAKKTGKAMAERPIHPTVIAEVRRYVEGRTSGRILTELFHHTKWEKIRVAAGMPDLTYHQLRKSFSSFIVQAGFSTAVASDLLEHSSPQLTQSVYLDTSPMHRAAAGAIPIDAILSAADEQPTNADDTPECRADRNGPAADSA